MVKAWQAMVFVGFVLVMVVFVFGGEGEPVGVATAVEVAERSAAERAEEEAGRNAAPQASELASPRIEEATQDAPVGFADYQIEEFGMPQSSAAPVSQANPWASSNSQREPRQDEVLPQGPPPPGPRDPSMTPPRVIPNAPSDDPNLKADLRAAIDRASQ